MKQCFSNLALEVIITKETKWHLLCCRCDSSSGPILIKTTIPSFCINQGPSTPVNVMVRDNVVTMSVAKRSLCPTFRVENDIWLVSFVMYINFLVPSLKNTAFIFPDMLYFISILPFKLQTSWHHHFPDLHNTKNVNVSETKKDISKRKKTSHSFFGKPYK